MRLRIVLVEPREAGNVGAAARAMKNFGVTDRRIVGRHGEKGLETTSTQKNQPRSFSPGLGGEGAEGG